MRSRSLEAEGRAPERPSQDPNPGWALTNQRQIPLTDLNLTLTSDRDASYPGSSAPKARGTSAASPPPSFSPILSRLGPSLSAAFRRPTISAPLGIGSGSVLGALLQARHSHGDEYQPSQRIRKRRHGFLARMRKRTGRKFAFQVSMVDGPMQI
ncbi:hypothetical protein OPQ81_005600 [Rhizoctonia solani]|nr:hypothetical protein OPQ81_005600 [Rhizoctonia solani]